MKSFSKFEYLIDFQQRELLIQFHISAVFDKGDTNSLANSCLSQEDQGSLAPLWSLGLSVACLLKMLHHNLAG